MKSRKLKIGWFSFSCCEDSTMVWIELMNENFFKWRDLLDIRHARVLKDDNRLDGIDVAFVEGAITNEADARKLRSIRKNSKKLVADGLMRDKRMPAGQRNAFDENTKKEIQFLLDRFKQADKVRKLSEIVQVDERYPDARWMRSQFLSALDKYLKEFGVSDA